MPLCICSHHARKASLLILLHMTQVVSWDTHERYYSICIEWSSVHTTKSDQRGWLITYPYGLCSAPKIATAPEHDFLDPWIVRRTLSSSCVACIACYNGLWMLVAYSCYLWSDAPYRFRRAVSPTSVHSTKARWGWVRPDLKACWDYALAMGTLLVLWYHHNRYCCQAFLLFYGQLLVP